MSFNFKPLFALLCNIDNPTHIICGNMDKISMQLIPYEYLGVFYLTSKHFLDEEQI